MQPTILYVEDDRLSRKVMHVLLTRMMGIEDVHILESSHEFPEWLETTSPDIFFLDIHVQPYDGFQMLHMVREHPAHYDKTVIALTASVMNEEVAELDHAGFDGLIAKPIDQDVFPDLMNAIMRGEKVWHIK